MRTLCISIWGSQAVLSGEEDSVVLAKANLEEMTIADLIEAMQGMENECDAQNYKTTEKISFPAMKVKFKGHRWTLIFYFNSIKIKNFHKNIVQIDKI